MNRSIVLSLLLLGGGCGAAVCDPARGEICTYAGDGTAGLKEGSSPRDARFYDPMDVTLGPDGKLYVVDWNNHRIRVVAGEAPVTTLIGTDAIGDVVGEGLEATLNHPTQVLFDAQGGLVIAAWHNSKVKRFDLATGVLSDLYGTGKRAYGGDGGPAKASDLNLPSAIAQYGGETFIMDQANQVIRRVDAVGMISRFAGRCIIETPTKCEPGEEPQACPSGNMTACGLATNPMACSTQPCSGGFGGDGAKAMDARMFQGVGQATDPGGRLAFDTGGNLYFADNRNHRIRKIDRDGVISTVAGNGTQGSSGDGGPATSAQLSWPVDLAFGPDGTLYVADMGNSCVRAIGVDGNLRTVAGVCGQRGYEGDGGAATKALLASPYGIEVTADGRLFIADTKNSVVRLVRL